MEELNNQNIDFKDNDNTKAYGHNSELFKISNKFVNSSQSKNLNNETFNQINVTTSNETETKIHNTLYKNNYLNYYLNNKNSCSCFNSKIKKMGDLKVYCFFNEQPLIVIGNKKGSLALIYEISLQLSFIIFIALLYKTIPFFMDISLFLIYLNCFLCHIFIFLSNPGIPSIDHYVKIVMKSENYINMNEEEKKNYYECDKCNIMFNDRENIEHCDECDICVENIDHHCFWTGKCITKKNIWPFYFFAFGTMIYILWYLVIIIYWAATQVGKIKN